MSFTRKHSAREEDRTGQGAHATCHPLSILRLFARLRWQRDPDMWTVSARDEHGRRVRVRVCLHEEGVELSGSAPGPWSMSALQVGRLRAALRDVLLTVDHLDHPDAPTGTRGSSLPDPPPTACGPRRRVDIAALRRPSVFDVAERIARTRTPEPEGTHDDGNARGAHGIGTGIDRAA